MAGHPNANSALGAHMPPRPKQPNLQAVALAALSDDQLINILLKWHATRQPRADLQRLAKEDLIRMVQDAYEKRQTTRVPGDTLAELQDMTVGQLRARAERTGAVLNGYVKKADLIAWIRAQGQ